MTTTTARKASPAKTAPVEVAAPAAAVKTTPGINFESLAAGATEAKAMPKVTRNRTSSSSGLTTLVTRSFTERKPFALPAVPTTDAKVTLTKMSSAIRRAAKLGGLGVSIRHEITDAGLVITLLGKAIGSNR